jgi:ribonuclease VapC
MSSVVLDASALLAVLNQEPGSERLTAELLSEAAASTVNLSEVHGKLVGRGGKPDEAWEHLMSLVRDPVPFTAEQAKLAGDLVLRTQPLGLSLGDRACLALGISLNTPIYTADRSWKRLKIGVLIHTIR